MTAVLEAGSLAVGIEIDGVVHVEYALRPATLNDVYRAAQAVPVPADIAGNLAASTAYQLQIDDAQVLCQLVSLGSLDPVPSPESLFEVLDPDDMAELRAAAGRVKKKRLQSRIALPTGGESNVSSSVPAST